MPRQLSYPAALRLPALFSQSAACTFALLRATQAGMVHAQLTQKNSTMSTISMMFVSACFMPLHSTVTSITINVKFFYSTHSLFPVTQGGSTHEGAHEKMHTGEKGSLPSGPILLIASYDPQGKMEAHILCPCLRAAYKICHPI